MKCARCQDQGWVCERHRGRPYMEGEPPGCTCGGAGAPCPDCNPCDYDNPPRMPPGYVMARCRGETEH